MESDYDRHKNTFCECLLKKRWRYWRENGFYKKKQIDEIVLILNQNKNNLNTLSAIRDRWFNKINKKVGRKASQYYDHLGNWRNFWWN